MLSIPPINVDGVLIGRDPVLFVGLVPVGPHDTRGAAEHFGQPSVPG